MEHIIVTTPDQLRGLIREVILEIAPKFTEERKTPDTFTHTKLTIAEAADFLTEQGLPTTVHSLYGHVFYRRIPFQKIGRRLAFLKEDLLEWVESRTHKPNEKQEATERIAAHCKTS